MLTLTLIPVARWKTSLISDDNLLLFSHHEIFMFNQLSSGNDVKLWLVSAFVSDVRMRNNRGASGAPGGRESFTLAGYHVIVINH